MFNMFKRAFPSWSSLEISPKYLHAERQQLAQTKSIDNGIVPAAIFNKILIVPILYTACKVVYRDLNSVAYATSSER